jgi:hypothetical protein
MQCCLALGESSMINGTSADRTPHIMRRYEETERDAINAEFDAFLAGLANANAGLSLARLAKAAHRAYRNFFEKRAALPRFKKRGQRGATD